jgi:hypothetical protein
MMLDRRIDKRRRVLWNGKLHRDGYILECEIFDILC